MTSPYWFTKLSKPTAWDISIRQYSRRERAWKHFMRKARLARLRQAKMLRLGPPISRRRRAAILRACGLQP